MTVEQTLHVIRTMRDRIGAFNAPRRELIARRHPTTRP